MRMTGVVVLGCLALATAGLRGQTSDEEKKKLFLQAREDIRPVPKPSASATPRPKPRPAEDPTPKPSHTPRKEVKESTPQKRAPRESNQDSDKPKPRSTPEHTPTPPKQADDKSEPRTRTLKPSPVDDNDVIALPDELPTHPKPEKPSPTPASQPSGQHAPTPFPPSPELGPVQIPQGKTPHGQTLDAPIHIEKSGAEEDIGLEPAPASSSSFFGFFKRYRYLTPGVRRAIDNARVQRGRWKYIVVHNSGTRQGNARIFDVYHRRVRKMQNGMAYHFVIGNGHSSGDGEIEIGNRWTRQINGGHVASDYLNNIALGICLVGDLNRDKPTPAQLAALDELITYLRNRVGKIKGKSTIVKGHKEINPKPTDCPGDRFPLGWLRQKFGQ